MTTPIFTFNPEISVSNSTAYLSGTATGDFTTADLLANGSDIGSVQVADGQWTFDADVGNLPSSVNFTLDVTDTSNNTISVNSDFKLVLDITNHPYTSMEVSNTDHGIQRMDCFNEDGRELYHMDYNVAGRVHNLLVAPNVHPATFVFVAAESVRETITDFIFTGNVHDTISMPATDFTRMADVLHNSSLSNGDWTIHDPKTDSVLTITGVKKGDMRAAARDFSFGGTGHFL